MAEPVERLTAALADRYRIERELGAGGMAMVYLAEDLKHRRKVAVKVLRPDLAATLGPERFLREVTIAANLQHPHVLPLYDSGQADGFLYYVMPYVEGTSLRQKLLREGELPIPDAVRILRDVADAMAYAHSHGVVHRDIKPENVMLSGRHALVTDFGVAKAVSEATGRQTLTTAGVALGTPTYMAPEQAAADPHTDHRADLYAFGVVAYELLTGRPPFVGGSPQAVLAAHVTAVAEPVTHHRASIPPALAGLVMKCLEKKPADRWQTAEELIPQLEAVLTPSGGTTPTATQPVAAAAPATAAGSWRKVIAAAVVVVAGTVGVWALVGRGTRAPDPGIRQPIVVLPFEVQGGEAALASLGVQAAEQIAAAIEQAGLGRVVPYRPEGGGQAFTEAVARRAIRETGAATLVTGSIAIRGEMEVQAKVVRAADLGTVWSLGPERGDATTPAGPLDALRERVLGAVGWYLSRATLAQTNPGIYQPPPSLEIFRLFEKANQLYIAGRNGEALPLFLEASTRDTAWLGGRWILGATFHQQGAWRQRDSVWAYLAARRERLAPGDALQLDYSQAWSDGSPEGEHRAAVALFTADSSQSYSALWSSVRALRPAAGLGYYAFRDSVSAWGRDWQGWDVYAAAAYHMLSRYEDELALAQAAKEREPRGYSHWEEEVRALACLERIDEVERVITESYGLELAGSPVRLMGAAAWEFSFHGSADAARGYSERVIAGVRQWPDSLQWSFAARNLLRNANRILGRHNEVVRLYEEESERYRDRGGIAYRILGMRYRILNGDTTGAASLADSAQTLPFEAYDGSGWTREGAPLYYGAQLLALLGRKAEAVALLRESLNHGWRLAVDEGLFWYWEPLRGYPPFQELVKLKDGS